MPLLTQIRIPVAVFATVFSAVLVATAQPPRERDERRPLLPPETPRPERSQAAPPRPGAQLWAVLNPEQRDKFRALMEENRNRVRELAEQTRRVRRELYECMFADEFKEDAIRKNAARLAELEGQRAMLQVKAFSQIRRSLTPEQLERLRDLRAEFAFGGEPRMQGPSLGRGAGRFEGDPPPWAGPRYREREPMPPDRGFRDSASPRPPREYDRAGRPPQERERDWLERPRSNRGESEQERPPAAREREREGEREREARPEKPKPRRDEDRKEGERDRPPAEDEGRR